MGPRLVYDQNQPSMDAERRVHQRRLVCIPCRIEVGGDLLTGRSYDLSDTGAAVITEAPLRGSPQCRIQFMWIDGRRSELRGQIRYSRPIHDGSEFMSGVSFMQVPDASVQELLAQL